MKKTFSSSVVVIGTIIGSGFASGKEISVFFSRFGILSFLFIFLAFFIFWGVIYLFFRFNSVIMSSLASSKAYAILMIVMSTIFASSMFAGSLNAVGENMGVKVITAIILLIVCFFIAKNGILTLTRLNFLLIPVTIVCMLITLISNLSLKFSLSVQPFQMAGGFYMILYCLMNFSSSTIVIAKAGEGLTKKQKVLSSFLISITLVLLLTLTNIVMLSHPQAAESEMPILFLAKGAYLMVVQFVIFCSCLTTLFSCVLTSCASLSKLNYGGKLTLFISILLPFCLSFLGFGVIVAYLYPIASVISLLGLIFAFRKRTSNENAIFR